MEFRRVLFRSAAEQPSTISNTATPKAADLSVRILSLGVIDRISGDIIPRSPMSPDDLVAVRFLISNSGNVPTGPWYFTAQLPTTAPNSAYASPVQASLAPGDSIENMLRFTYAVPKLRREDPVVFKGLSHSSVKNRGVFERLLYIQRRFFGVGLYK